MSQLSLWQVKKLGKLYFHNWKWYFRKVFLHKYENLIYYLCEAKLLKIWFLLVEISIAKSWIQCYTSPERIPCPLCMFFPFSFSVFWSVSLCVGVFIHTQLMIQLLPLLGLGINQSFISNKFLLLYTAAYTWPFPFRAWKWFVEAQSWCSIPTLHGMWSLIFRRYLYCVQI